MAEDRLTTNEEFRFQLTPAYKAGSIAVMEISPAQPGTVAPELPTRPRDDRLIANSTGSGGFFVPRQRRRPK